LGGISKLQLPQGQLGICGGFLDVERGQGFGLAWVNGGDAEDGVALDDGARQLGVADLVERTHLGVLSRGFVAALVLASGQRVEPAGQLLGTLLQGRMCSNCCRVCSAARTML
jgi:hypothetical protein